MATNHEVNESQKELCAVTTMRDMAGLLAEEKGIPYDEALFRFTSSAIYDALFDFETGIWKESPIYLLDLYKRFGEKTPASCSFRPVSPMND